MLILVVHQLQLHTTSVHILIQCIYTVSRSHISGHSHLEGFSNVLFVMQVYIPIYQGQRYYLIVVDIKRISITLIDSTKDYPESYYHNVPRRLVSF